MSRIGKQPVALPSGVTAEIADRAVTLKGAKGDQTLNLPANISVSQEGSNLIITRDAEDKQTRANHGTIRALLANIAIGVQNGYSRDLEIHGVGFRAALAGNELTMSVGYSHPVVYTAPDGITLTVTDNTNIKVSGIDKQLVGQVSARIRAFCPPEPYKGKGIRYKDERVRRKVGKTVA